MSTPILTPVFNFSLFSHEGRIASIGLYVSPDPGYSASMRIVNLPPYAGAHQALGVKLEAVPEKTVLRVVLSVSAATDEMAIELGEIKFKDESLSTEAMSDLADEFSEAASQGLFLAMRGGASVSVATVNPFAVGKPENPTRVPPKAEKEKRSWRGMFTFRRFAAVAVLGAVALIGFGAYQSSKPSDPYQEMLSSDSYNDIQKEIRARVAEGAKTGNGAFGALQGQVVAIETMKAMGLDPGKANTGCLVGAK